jgi:hypothetical protein
VHSLKSQLSLDKVSVSVHMSSLDVNHGIDAVILTDWGSY